MNSTDTEDWFTCSAVVSSASGEEMGSFSIGDDKFKM